MSYAVKNDGTGFRAVLGEEDILDGEFFSIYMPQEVAPLSKTIEEVTREVRIARDTQLALASLRLGPLKDAEEDGVATEDELAKLRLWKDYRIALNRIEGQEGFPNNISWPQSPEA